MQAPAPERTLLQRWTFIVLFFVILYLFWRIAEPLWVPISLGSLVAIGMHPLHKKLLGKFKSKSRDAFSAFIITSGVLLVGLALAVFFGAILLRQVLSMAHEFAVRSKQQTATEMLGPRISEFLSSMGEDPARLQQQIANLGGQLAGMLANSATRVLAASAGALLVIVFTAITSYYLLRNGEQFTNWLVMALPMPDGEVWELVRNFRDVARVMLLGTGATALYQGVISFFGYWLAGVPNPLVWGTATGFASIVPAIGTAIIWAPVCVYLIINHHVGMAIALFVYSNGIVVGIADYVLRPKLLGSKVKMNDLLIFIALFGGIEAFGILGTILGPIIAALMMSMIHIYLRDYRPRSVHPKEAPALAKVAE